MPVLCLAAAYREAVTSETVYAGLFGTVFTIAVLIAVARRLLSRRTRAPRRRSR
ncbi:hypothetical protein GCM10009679_56760 [Saccharothrix algeriensis]|uniref:Uncharacterized protein n=1 Tax=Catellatospora bangladeshensis TaxID=310355 RepID=A0A8J3NI70_9ACTN|nr:hypothetical protein Cba03nite_32310 [Catellatospora bangladeshensis]